MDRVKRASVFAYGLDGPGWCRGFALAALAAAVLGGTLIAVTPLAWLGVGMLVAGLVPGALAISMLTYSYGGKQRLRDHLLGRRAWRGDEIVVDLGSGRGLMAVGCAHRVPRGRVLAIDLWSTVDLTGNGPGALRRNAEIEGVADRIEIVTGDARSLALPNASVDVVASAFCLHNIEPSEDRDRACAEIARVLKPGGQALIPTFQALPPTPRPCQRPA